MEAIIPLEHRGILISHVDDLLCSVRSSVLAPGTRRARLSTVAGRSWRARRASTSKARGIFLSLECRKERAAAATEVERSQLRSVLGSPEDDVIQCNQLLDFVKATPERGCTSPTVPWTSSRPRSCQLPTPATPRTTTHPSRQRRAKAGLLIPVRAAAAGTGLTGVHQ